jgi:2-dehydro-3-deoxyglucarate aldolase/4-hydroxy-2-oxoheptanedioate aldolase
MAEQRERFANVAKKALKRGERVVGSMSSVVGCPEVMQIFAVAGLDYVIIDCEHSPYDILTLRRLVGAARLAGIVPYVRVPDAQYHLIARVLDAGALGVMVPRVERKETVEEVVAAVKYPPLGRRGCGAIDLQNDFLPTSVTEHIARGNEETLVIIQMESREALEHIEEFAAIKGVDVILVGPNDFSISLGIPSQFQSETYIQGVMRTIKACEKAGIASGIHVRDIETLEFWANRGMRFLTCASDLAVLKKGIDDLGRRLKELKMAGAS